MSKGTIINRNKNYIERKQTFYEAHIKRVIDLGCAFSAIIVFWWLYLIIAILVKVRLGSPVIFKQKRPGLNEKIFEMYKFRSMSNETDENGNLLPDNVRLGKFGKLLRATSLDELPEVLNILKGDMSLIGPRPQLVRDMVFMSPRQRRRHTVKPGMSGLAQVNGRNAITWEDKLELDLKYINKICFLSDLSLVIQTVKKAFIKQEGITDGKTATSLDYGDYLLKIGKIDQETYDRKQDEAKRILLGNLPMDVSSERLVSIITPAYNAEKYIGEAIDSVIAQTYQNWEMIIVDDGSKDKTVEIIRLYDDPRIKLYTHERNFGVATAMNTAISLAQGSLLAFLDADDVWKPNKLMRHVNFMLSNDYGFTFSAYEIMRKGKNKFVHVPRTQNYNQYMRNTVIGTSAVMLNLDIVGSDFKMVNIRKDLDSMTWARLLRTGHKAYGLDESLTLYRKVDTSISNDKWKAAINHWQNMRKIEKIPVWKCAYYFVGYSLNATLKHFF